MISHLIWIGGSLGGALFGELIGHEWMGFPFALVGLFICFLVLQIKSLHFFGVMILVGILSVFVKADQREQEGGRNKKEKNLNIKGSYEFYGFCPPWFWIIGIVLQDPCQGHQEFMLHIFAENIDNTIIILACYIFIVSNLHILHTSLMEKKLPFLRKF
jgi:hypothetical protein